MRFEKLATLLNVARKLAGSAEGLTIDDIAAEAAVDRRTAERMRDTLRDLFPTLEEGRDGRTKRFAIRGGLDGFMQAPSADELAELQNAVKSLESRHHSARAALLRSLDVKVKGALRASQRQRIEPDLEALMSAEGLVMQAGPRPRVAAETLAQLREALKACRLCHFRYQGSKTGTTRAHVVRPWGILYGKMYYLVGAPRGRDEPVLWRLDRMNELRLGGAAEPAPADFNLGAFASRSFGAFQEDPEDIVLRFAAGAAADAENFLFHPSQRIEREREGSVIVRFRCGGLLELVRHLFTWGASVEILSPAALKDLMVRELEVGMQKHGRKRPDHPNGSRSSS